MCNDLHHQFLRGECTMLAKRRVCFWFDRIHILTSRQQQQQQQYKNCRRGENEMEKKSEKSNKNMVTWSIFDENSIFSAICCCSWLVVLPSMKIVVKFSFFVCNVTDFLVLSLSYHSVPLKVRYIFCRFSFL